VEPLLDRIAEDKRNVVCPVIDVIEDDSFKYQYGNARSTSIGGFDWNLQFNWHAIPEDERARRDYKDYAPVRFVHAWIHDALVNAMNSYFNVHFSRK
jgi:polypeptide N-acetylgalactosaminyltransferase